MNGTFSKKRTALMLAGIVGIGISLSFLLEVNYGTDTCSFMNASLSARVGLSYGTTMVLANLIFFIPVIFWGRHLIGPGTIANMFCIGYISDFCRMLEHKFLPAEIFTGLPYRPVVFVLALIPFLISVALYINADAGQAPYDAIPSIISERLHLPYSPVRIGWDCFAVLIGIFAGGRLTIATVILAFAIGPSVTVIGRLLPPGLSDSSCSRG